MEERQVSVDGQPRPLPEPVPGGRDAEPGRVRGHLPAARGAARPVPAQADAAAAAARATRSRCCSRHADGFDPRDLRRGRASGRWPAPADLAAGARGGARASRSPPRSSATSSTSPAPPARRRRCRSGVSPRGATALLATSRAWAWLDGRDFVTPDDVKALAHADAARTGCRCGPRPSSRASTSAPCCQRAARPCRCPVDRADGRAPWSEARVALTGRSRCCCCSGWCRSPSPPGCDGAARGGWSCVAARRPRRAAGAEPAAGCSAVARAGGARCGSGEPTSSACCWSPTPPAAALRGRAARRLAALGRARAASGTLVVPAAASARRVHHHARARPGAATGTPTG